MVFDLQLPKIKFCVDVDVMALAMVAAVAAAVIKRRYGATLVVINVVNVVIVVIVVIVYVAKLSNLISADYRIFPSIPNPASKPLEVDQNLDFGPGLLKSYQKTFTIC